jgi:hypothetical protein
MLPTMRADKTTFSTAPVAELPMPMTNETVTRASGG